MDNETPLVKGGQGRTGAELDASANAITGAVLVGAAVMAEFLIWRWGGSPAGLLSLSVAGLVGVCCYLDGWRRGARSERARIRRGVDAIERRART